jgi:two-component system KDP operon response regulator KdpE
MDRKILVVDDEPEMAEMLGRALAKENYDVLVALNGREGLRQAHRHRPDLVVLDVMMPDMSGWETLRRLREFSQVPVIMLTAVNDENSKIQGLDLGADDYVTKPFGIRELKARIRAALRRAETPSLNGGHLLVFNHGELIVDPFSYRVTVRGEPVDLTPTEHKLLFYLAHNAGQVLTQEQILEQVWGPGYEGGSNSVKVYIQRLRRRIEANPSKPCYVLTQRGVGYCLAKI